MQQEMVLHHCCDYSDDDDDDEFNVWQAHIHHANADSPKNPTQDSPKKDLSANKFREIFQSSKCKFKMDFSIRRLTPLDYWTPSLRRIAEPTKRE